MTMPRSSDVTSFTEHRQRLREQLRRAGETGRPLFVTTNGVTDAVYSIATIVTRSHFLTRGFSGERTYLR